MIKAKEVRATGSPPLKRRARTCLHLSPIPARAVRLPRPIRAYDLDTKRGRDYVEAVKRGRVLLAQYTGSHDAGWKRVTGSYIAVYAVEDVTFSPDTGLRFKARRLKG